MKPIENKQFTKDVNTGKDVNTASLLRDALNFTPQSGLDIPTIRARLRVFEALEKPKNEKGDFDLEDSDFTTAQEAIRSVRWVRSEKYIIQFADQFQV